MKRMMAIVPTLLTLTLVSTTRSHSDTQAAESIPADIDPNLKASVEQLLNLSATHEQIIAAKYLGEMGAGASPAIPYLIDNLSNNRYMKWVGDQLWPSMAPYQGTTTSPGMEAQAALVLIGKPAVPGLIDALSDKEKEAISRRRAAHALGEIGDQRALEPLLTATKDEDTSVCEAAKRALDALNAKPDSPATTKE